MAELKLTNDKTIQRDDADLALVSAYTWCIQKTPEGKQYVFATIKDDSGKTKRLYLPRFLMNPPEGFVVKNIDGNPLDCLRSNLQVLKHSQDKRKQKESTASKFKGVRYVPKGKKHWAASITVDGEYRHLGVFDTELEAAEERDQAAFGLWGEFALLNNPVIAERV
jgi:hypothetical protein